MTFKGTVWSFSVQGTGGNSCQLEFNVTRDGDPQSTHFKAGATTDARIFLGMCAVLQAAMVMNQRVWVQYDVQNNDKVATGLGIPADAVPMK